MLGSNHKPSSPSHLNIPISPKALGDGLNCSEAQTDPREHGANKDQLKKEDNLSLGSFSVPAPGGLFVLVTGHHVVVGRCRVNQKVKKRCCETEFEGPGYQPRASQPSGRSIRYFTDVSTRAWLD